MGTPPSESVKLVVNGGIKLDNGDEFYFFATTPISRRTRASTIVCPRRSPIRPAKSTVTILHSNDIYLDPCTSAYTGCPTGGSIQDSNTFNFNSVYPGGFTPRFFGVTQQFFGTLGYKGVTSWGMNYDVSGTTAQNSLALSLKT